MGQASVRSSRWWLKRLTLDCYRRFSAEEGEVILVSVRVPNEKNQNSNIFFLWLDSENYRSLSLPDGVILVVGHWLQSFLISMQPRCRIFYRDSSWCEFTANEAMCPVCQAESAVHTHLQLVKFQDSEPRPKKLTRPSINASSQGQVIFRKNPPKTFIAASAL